MKIGNTLFIPQNIAPANAKALAIFDAEGNKKGTISLGNLKQKDIGSKLYSSLLISDIHVFANSSYKADSTANDDYATALQFAQFNADFTCICGDLTCYGHTPDFEKYKSITEVNSGGKPVYAIAGNHECWGRKVTPPYNIDLATTLPNYTGFPLYYTITHNENPTILEDDVFIFCSIAQIDTPDYSVAFSKDTLQWLYEQLEKYRNKRCFLFHHCFIQGSQYCGDAIEKYTAGDLMHNYRSVFVSLLSHYRNVIYFHGHSHESLNSQLYTESLTSPLPANYDYALGCHSVHIPSLAIPYDISSGERVLCSTGSEGYLMDVYEKHIILKGIDFVTGNFLPIANYCLNTDIIKIEANTFKDSTGTIVTAN